MIMASFRRWSFATACLMCSTTMFGQGAAGVVKPVDERVARLSNQEPASYVSEEPYAVEWPKIAMSNVLWKKRVWKTMDVRDAGNVALTQTSTSIGNLLMEGVRNGNLKAYSADAPLWTKEFSKEAFSALPGLNAGLITRVQVLEDWMYLEEEHKLVGRIIGIAPVREVIAADGTVTNQPIFWMYYPEVRSSLRRQAITGSKDAAVQNLDQWFETHQYAAQIDKVSGAGVRPK